MATLTPIFHRVLSLFLSFSLSLSLATWKSHYYLSENYFPSTFWSMVQITCCCCVLSSLSLSLFVSLNTFQWYPPHQLRSLSRSNTIVFSITQGLQWWWIELEKVGNERKKNCLPNIFFFSAKSFYSKNKYYKVGHLTRNNFDENRLPFEKIFFSSSPAFYLFLLPEKFHFHQLNESCRNTC